MKSFLSLDRNAIFTIRKNGIEAKYTAYQGNEFMEYDLLYEKSTDQENGVKCEISIKSSSEYWDFELKCIKKLAYYDTVILNINNEIQENIITRTDLFQFSSQHEFNTLHLCLKDVVYEIDYTKLGINAIYLPIALRFDLSSGLMPTPSRESLILNESSKQLILSKIKEVSNWFINRYNEENSKEFDTIREIYDQLENDYKEVTIEGKTFNVEDIVKYSDVQLVDWKVKNYSNLRPLKWFTTRKSYFLEGFSQIAKYNGRSWSSKRLYDLRWSKYNNSSFQFVICDSTLTIYLKQYLIDKFPRKELVIIRPSRKLKLFGSTSYMDTCKLYEFSKDKWRTIIQDWQRFENEYISTIPNFVGIQETPEFIKFVEDYKAEQKANRVRGIYSNTHKVLNKQKGEITLSLCRKKNSGYGNMFEKQTMAIGNLGKQKQLWVYFVNEEDKELASNLYTLFGQKIKVAFALKSEVKHLTNFHQFLNYQQFMQSQVFKRTMSSQIYGELLETYKDITKSNIDIIKNVLKPLANDIQKLKDYCNKNGKYIDDNELLNSMKAVAKEHNLYDYSLWDVYNRVKKELDKYSFISMLEVPKYWDENAQKSYKSLINQLLYHNLVTNKQLPDNLEVQFVEKEKSNIEESVELEETLA